MLILALLGGFFWLIGKILLVMASIIAALICVIFPIWLVCALLF